MRNMAIIDTGPLVAALNSNDIYYSWTVAELKKMREAMLTCEAVLSEAFFLLRTVSGATEKLWGMINHGGLQVAYSLDNEYALISRLMLKYSDVF